MENDALTKEEVRGSRNIKAKTVKKPAHVFDDEKGIKGGRRGHGRNIPGKRDPLDEIIDDLNDGIDDNVDWKKLIR